MKDLVAGIRTSSSERKALQDGFNKTLQQLEEYCKHMRGNTNDIKTSASHIKNTAANIRWELSELRTGGHGRTVPGGTRWWFQVNFKHPYPSISLIVIFNVHSRWWPEGVSFPTHLSPSWDWLLTPSKSLSLPCGWSKDMYCLAVCRCWTTMACNPKQMSNERNLGCLGYTGDYTTQLYGDYN